MQRLIVSVAALAGLLSAASAQASTWEIDPAHTSAQFAVRHLMVSTVRGTMGKVTGVANINEQDITKSSVEATVDVTGLNTGEPKRDEHLKGPDFFEVAKYPKITFKSKKVERVSDTKYTVTGDLTIKGTTKEVVLAVEGSPKPINDPFGNVKVGGIAKTKINRQDFGIVWGKALDTGGVVVGDDVEITIDIELTQKKS